MDIDTLLEELDGLLNAGEGLLRTFPTQRPDSWVLQLPGSVSDTMRWYANLVAHRAWNSRGYHNFRQQLRTDYLTGLDRSAYDLVGMVKDCESGLLGWRAVGVIR